LVTAKKAKSSAKSGSKVVKKPAAKAVKKTVAKTVVKKTVKPKTPAKVVAKAKAKPAVKVAKVAKAPAKPVEKVAKAPAPVAKPVARPKVIERPVAKMAPPNTERVGGMLSEAEIIKQAKSDYMSKDQLKFFKYRLLELQSQLRENADATTEHLRELAVAPDPADRATLEEEHALELRARDRERKLLKKVDQALVRIEDGSYGYCEETGDPIGIQRLLARPTATLTIEAQERRELKQKMYGE